MSRLELRVPPRDASIDRLMRRIIMNRFVNFISIHYSIDRNKLNALNASSSVSYSMWNILMSFRA